MLIACIIVIIVVILVIVLWKKKDEKKQIAPATNIKITFIGRIDNMEQLRFTWTPPQGAEGDFLETQRLFVSINGATPGQVGGDLPAAATEVDASFETGVTIRAAIQVGADLPAAATEVDASFETGVTIRAAIQTVGDNGSENMSDYTSEYIVSDKRTIGKASAPGIAWLGHIS